MNKIRNLLHALFSLIGELISSFIYALLSVFDLLRREVRASLFGIKSPSATTRHIGAEIMYGLKSGLVLGEMKIKLKRVNYRRPYTYRKRLLGISFEVSRFTFTKPYEPLARALETWDLIDIDSDYWRFDYGKVQG